MNVSEQEPEGCAWTTPPEQEIVESSTWLFKGGFYHPLVAWHLVILLETLEKVSMMTVMTGMMTFEILLKMAHTKN